MPGSWEHNSVRPSSKATSTLKFVNGTTAPHLSHHVGFVRLLEADVCVLGLLFLSLVLYDRRTRCLRADLPSLLWALVPATSAALNANLPISAI